MNARGVVVAAPASGSGKTTVVLGLLRHFAREGRAVAAFKTGPDYIDPAFHAAAAGRPCVTLDSWAMRPGTVDALFRGLALPGGLVVGEGAMGLLDGAPGGGGSTAEIAVRFGLPVVLVVDASGQAQSAAATVHGFATWPGGPAVAGAIFNRVGGERHAAVLRDAAAALDVPLLGCLPRSDAVALPSRHLGLVQASETEALGTLLDDAADLAAAHLDLDRLVGIAADLDAGPGADPPAALPPPGGRVAVARDDAFRFDYPHVLDGWRRAGAEVATFSPLADEAPDARADAVYLPGGYPELHAGRLAGNAGFLAGLRTAAARGAWVYGECGGYMALGETLVDGDGASHRMAGLLPLETSFAERRLHLGYRRAELAADCALGRAGDAFGAHEFHYAAATREDGADSLFAVRDASGRDLGPAGLRRGRVMGSFVHLVDARPDWRPTSGAV